MPCKHVQWNFILQIIQSTQKLTSSIIKTENTRLISQQIVVQQPVKSTEYVDIAIGKRLPNDRILPRFEAATDRPRCTTYHTLKNKNQLQW